MPSMVSGMGPERFGPESGRLRGRWLVRLGSKVVELEGGLFGGRRRPPHNDAVRSGVPFKPTLPERQLASWPGRKAVAEEQRAGHVGRRSGPGSGSPW